MDVAMLFKNQIIILITAFLVACGGGGGGGGSSSPAPVNNIIPVVDAGSDQVVNENSTVTLTATASDADGISSQTWTQVSGPSVNLNNVNNLISTFTAPFVSENTTLEFKVVATDSKGGKAEDSVIISITNNNAGPTADAGADKAAVSGANVILTGADSSDSATSFSWQVISGSSGIVLASKNSEQTTFTAPYVANERTAIFQLTVTDLQGETNKDQIIITISPGTGDISGVIKYENVPHTSSSKLDYDNSTLDFVRGIDVELIDATTINSAPIILATTKTNALGEYSFANIASGKSAIVRVKSTYSKTATNADLSSWDMKVVDNTNDDAIYALDSSAFVITPTMTIKDLTALSGWSSSDNDYASPRAAAPFHILDRAYDMVNKIVAVDTDVVMPAVTLNWSINNRPTSGDRTIGNIGTSHYTNNNLYILGDKDTDTDEYDGHVILHELGHYFEDNFSRADSIGGNHGSGDRLDMRVAFGEGFGNAWSGMITDDSYYRDSSISGGSLVGFDINVERNDGTNKGWYSESSIQSILYDIYDDATETNDSVSLGLAPIYNVLTGAQKNTPALTSIFSFAAAIKAENPAADTDINTLLTAQSIVGSGMDIYGSTETNNAGNANVLPIYTDITANGIASSEVCSIKTFSTKNKLSVYRFFKFTANTTATYTFSASSTGTTSPAIDPDIKVFKDGVLVDKFETTGPSQTGDVDLSPGDYVIAIVDFNNITEETNNEIGCFTLSITQI